MGIFNRESFLLGISEEEWEFLYKYQNEHPKEWKHICKEGDKREKEARKIVKTLGKAFAISIDKEIISVLK